RRSGEAGSRRAAREEVDPLVWAAAPSSTPCRASGCARLGPEIDAALRRVPVDCGQLLFREVPLVEGGQVLLELGDARGPDERRGHARVAKRPGERHLSESLAAGLC